MTTPNRRKLAMVTAIVALANLLDLASTYAVSPDLANEWNLLQRQFGLGWLGLIAAKLVGGFVAVAGYAYYLRCREACYPRSGVDREAFCRFFAFARPNPDDPRAIWRHVGVCLGYFWAGMQLLVFWVAIDNLLLRVGYYCPLRDYTELGYHLLQSLVVGYGVMARFYQGNYRRYAARCAAEGGASHTPALVIAPQPDGGIAG